ncbi:hypothetical protein ACO3UB_01655 [Methanocaldococcus sp. 16A]
MVKIENKLDIKSTLKSILLGIIKLFLSIIKYVFYLFCDIIKTTWGLWIPSVFVITINWTKTYNILIFILFLIIFLIGIFMFKLYKKDDNVKKEDYKGNIDKHVRKNFEILGEKLLLPLLKVLFVIYFIFVLIIIKYANYLEYIYSIVELFRIDSIKSFFVTLWSENPTILLSIIVTVISAYIYMLDYMAQHRRLMFSREWVGKKYLLFMKYLYGYFNYFIIPFIMLPFMIHKHLWLEIFFIILMYYLTTKYFIPIIHYYSIATCSYEFINRFNIARKKDEIQTLMEVLFLILNYEKSKKDIKIYEKIETFLRKSILIFIENVDLLQKLLISLIVLLSIIFWFLKFNFLTILYIFLTLTYCYMIICYALQDFPNYKADIYLNNNEKIKDVYIIEDNPEGYIVVLDKNDRITKIMKSSIIKIEYKNP